MSFSFNQGDRPLEGYTIQRGVGRGGFGEVYHALSDGGKEVALKYLRDNPQIELRGVQNCLNLKSPHLVTIYDVKQSAAGDWFVVMEYVNGPSLRDLLIESPSGLGAQKAAYFLREIGKGLTYLHDRGIVHRDIKPGNIFYEDGYVKICDYGLSKAMSPSQHSGQTMSVGTVHYMAPEVGSGNYSKTIDIYAMGVMLYEMLLGRVPYQGATMGEVLMKHLTAQPEVDQLPAPFPDVIRRSLAKDPNDRYVDMPSMVSAVFANANLEQSVATFEPMSLTRVAARAAELVGAGVRGSGANWGSSQVPTMAAGGAPPVVAKRGARGGSGAARARRGEPDSDRRWQRDFAPWMDIDGDDKAAADPERDFPPRSRWVAGLLGITLGMFGVHRFYLGYVGIGVFQVLLTCFTGIGALWGFAEGIIILGGGRFPDALGRPLVRRGPDQRSGLARFVWAVVAGGSMIGAFALLIVGTFAEPEYETRPYYNLATGESVEFNFDMMRVLYFVASGLIAIGAFGVWKSSHRAQLGAWRATVRPLLMCLSFGGVCAAAAFAFNFAAGYEQLVGMGAAAGMGALFTTFWMLRGPPPAALADDVYWHSAWRSMFKFVGIVSMLGLFACAKNMPKRPLEMKPDMQLFSFREAERGLLPFAGNERGRAEAHAESLRSAAADQMERLRGALATGRARDIRIKRSEHRSDVLIANLMYDPVPLAAALIACVMVGSLNESRHRKNVIKRSSASGAGPAA